MEDHPFTEDASSFGKRKRSPDNLVDISIPTSPRDGQTPGILEEHPVPSPLRHPLPKRPRLPPKPPLPISSIDILPSAIWQIIFSYVDPAALSCLVSVNTRFRSLLDSRYDLPHGEENFNIALRSQDSIWTLSRRRFIPAMPKPMAGLSEQAQFFLAFGSKCQFCGQPPLSRSGPSGSWFGSSVPNPIRVVWPFKVRSCTTCLVPRLQKDTDVLLSDASPLRAGLAFALFTQSMLYVPSEVIRNSVAPKDIQMTKYHFQPHIESLSQKAREAQSLGAAAAEGWFQGLPQEGQAAQHEAARFEHWELTGGLSSAQSMLSISRVGGRNRDQHEMLATQFSAGPSLPFTSLRSTKSPVHVLPSCVDLPQMPLHTYGVAPGLESPYQTSRIQPDAASMDSQKSNRAQKAAPSSREIARIKSRKKHDIVERCRKLNPPILLDMLERLDAFEAALQIPMPLNENAWETLKQRLLQQRHQAVLQDEARDAVTRAPVPGQFRPPSRTDEHVLAHADMPIRQKLCGFAEEYIKQKWGQGAYVTYPSSPHFAVDVLIHTRQAYLDNKSRIELLEKSRIETLEAQNGYLKFTSEEDEVLTLDHMKWVFEQSIKPRTEQIRKDLFLCSFCTSQGTIRYNDFVPTLQHYASKHTSDFSRGTQVLSWKARWPDQSPFEAHPERIHTPEPSITHTPTLSNIPLSVTSLGSNANTIMQSSGWKSPDTMSLMSSTTNTFSTAFPSTQSQQVPIAAAPGDSMFHTQRDKLASGMLHGWHMVSKTPNVPESLQLYLALNFAIQNFRKQYSNEPSLELFNDCLAKPELADLRAIKDLKCWECVIRQNSSAHASWPLQHLIDHFEKAHLERYSGSLDRLRWNMDMIALPEPALIKSLLTVGDLPNPLQKTLLDAHIAAVTKTTKIENTNMESAHRWRSVNYGRAETEFHEKYAQATIPDTLPAKSSHSATLLRYQKYTENSAAATWGELNSSRDYWSASSGTLEGDTVLRHRDIPTRESISNPYRRLIELVPSPQGPRTSSRPNSVLDERDGDSAHVVPEPMSRSNTVRSARSHKSISKPQALSATEDFLSTIESSLEVEMAESGLDVHHGPTVSRPISRSTSAAGSINNGNRRASPIQALKKGSATSSRILRDHNASPARSRPRTQSPSQYYLETPATRMILDNTSPQSTAVTRGTSRMVEFDEAGRPILSQGRVHQVSPPPHHHFTRQLVDTYHHASQPISPSYRQSYREVQTTANQPERYSDNRSLPHYVYEPVERVSTTLHRDRIYDPLTRQYYIVERPTVRHYVPIDDSHGRPVVLYDERGLPIDYRNTELNNHRFEDRGGGHETRQGERFGHGYQRR